jgi:glycosyltransferase involved in cell wall biosynthesis
MSNNEIVSQEITQVAVPLRTLIIGFAYIVDVYQSKLKSIQDTGLIDVAWLAPTKWKMRSWNRIIPLKRKFEEIRVYPVVIWFLNGINGGYLYPTLPLLRAIRNFRPDILHYEQEVFSLSAFQSALWAYILKIPFTVFCWENVEKSLPFYRRWTTKFVLHVANAVVAGNNEAAHIVRSWGYKGKIVIMPQIGVDTNLFFPRHQIRTNHVFTLGYIGRLVPEKGVDLLFDAVRQLIENDISLRIIVCGSGYHESVLRSYAKQLKIDEYVSWLGPIKHDDIPDVLIQTDVVVLPSRTLPGKWKEQFGHILIEAMAMGILVVGSDSGAIPEVIGRADLIFPENNADELVRILKRVIFDREWAQDVSKYLKFRAVEEYSDRKIAALLMSLWREIVIANR